MCHDTSKCIMWWVSESWLTVFKVLKERFRNFSPHKAWEYSALNILLDPSFHINFYIMTIIKQRYVSKLRNGSIPFKSLPCWKHYSSLRSHLALEVGSSFQNSMGWDMWNRRPKAIARVGIAATPFSNWACISVHLKSSKHLYPCSHRYSPSGCVQFQTPFY